MKNLDEKYYNNIRDTLVFREGAVRVDADGNLLNLAVLSEGFYCALLNNLMGWNLINANIEKQNVPGIDLIDREQKIAVQVSLTCDHEKVQHSIDKFKADSYDGWHFYYVPIKKDSSNFRKDFTLPEGVRFNEKEDVLSISRIMRIVEQEADIDKKHELSLLMDKYTKESDPHLALCKRLYDSLKDVRDHHPSFRLMSEDGIDRLLFPHTEELIPALGDVDGNIAPIWDHIKAEHKEGFRHIIIEGTGGIGKSVSLLSVTEDNELLTEIPAIYIHMYDLVYGGNCLTLPEYLAHNADYNGINDLCSEGGKPKLMLLLDGLNEVAFEHQDEILHSIKHWASGHRGAQLIIASRPIPGRQLDSILGMVGLHIELKGIEKEQAKERLETWGIPLPDKTALIWETLKLPLFLTLYAKTANLPEMTPSGYSLDVREPAGQGSLIWNYLQRELLRKDNTCWPMSCAITCEYIAPYIAYKMALANKFEVGHEEAEKLVEEAIDSIDLNVLPVHLGKVNSHRRHHRKVLPNEDWETFVLEESGIFVVPKHSTVDEDAENKKKTNTDEDEYSFVHQNFRDCLAGLYLVNQAEMAGEDKFPKIWERNQSHLMLDYAAELMDSDVLGKLWKTNRKVHTYRIDESKYNHTATCNLLELCKRNDNLPQELNFSGMDLRGLSLTHYLGQDGKALPLFQNSTMSKGSNLDRFVFESEGHTRTIEVIAVLPYGRVISGSYDRTLRVWDTATGQCLQTLKGHRDRIRCVTGLSEGRVISGSDDCTLRVWDAATGQCLRTLTGHKDRIRCVAVLPDGLVVSGSDDHTLRVWNASTGQCQQILEGHRDRIRCIAILPDGRVVSGSYDSTLRVWNAGTGQCLQTLEGHTNWVTCVTVLPDGLVVSGSSDNTLRVWDTSTGHCQQTLEGNNYPINCVAVLSDGRVVSGSSDSILRVWDAATGQCQQILKGHEGYINCITVLPDERVVSGSHDCTLRVWDTTTSRCQKILEGHKGNIYCVAVLPDGRVVSGSGDRTLRVWDATSGQCHKTFEVHETPINCIAELSNGRMVCGSADETLRVWDVNSGKCLRTLKGHTNMVTCVTVLQDGRVVSGSGDRTLRVWDVDSGKCLRTLMGHTKTVTCVAVLPDGRVVSGSADETLRVWDVNSGKCLRTMKGHTYMVTCVVVLPNGRVVSGSGDHTLRVWDSTTGRCQLTLKEHTESIICVAVLPGGHVISGSSDSTLRVWTASLGQCLHTLKGHKYLITCLAVLPDGRVVSGSYGSTLRVWSATTGQTQQTLGGHTGYINCVAALSNGRVVSGSDDGTLRIWEPESGECLDTLEATEIDVTMMDVSDAIVTDDLARLLWQNGAKISDASFEQCVAPYQRQPKQAQ